MGTANQLIEMVGRQFGKWTVIARAGKDTDGGAMWLCRCSCEYATERVQSGRILRKGLTKSCGCVQAHGHTVGGKRSPTLESHRAMIQRTGNPNHQRFPFYGANGVTVCDGLREFKGFLAILGVRPQGSTLGRFGDTGNYSCGACPQCLSNGWPRNCAWQTDAEQKQTARTKRQLPLQCGLGGRNKPIPALKLFATSIKTRGSRGQNAISRVETLFLGWGRTGRPETPSAREIGCGALTARSHLVEKKSRFAGSASPAIGAGGYLSGIRTASPQIQGASHAVRQYHRRQDISVASNRRPTQPRNTPA
jgi:hypothetical protein